MGEILPVLERKRNEDIMLKPITWVDDVAVMVEDQSAEQLLQKVGKVAVAMKKHADSHGLCLNFKKGKTEASVRFQGPGSAKVYRQFREEGSSFRLEDAGGHDLTLLSTTRYSHLGAMQTTAMTNQMKVTTRIAKAGSAFRTVDREEEDSCQ